MLGRLEAALPIGPDDVVRDLRVPDPELVIEDVYEFPWASSSNWAR